jgi:hypothetical protein
VFKELSGNDGGAVSTSDGSNITLSSNIFIGNRAQSFGGDIFANKSLILFDILSRNVFLNNLFCSLYPCVMVTVKLGYSLLSID